MAEAFTYCWTDKSTNKLYVGCHKGSQHDGYIASSKVFLEEYNSRPEDFSREILAEGLYSDMLKFETAILKAVDAKYSNDYYNQHNGDGKFYRTVVTQETRNKLAAAQLGKKLSAERKQKISETMKTKRHSAETKAKMSANRKGKKPSAHARAQKRDYWQKMTQMRWYNNGIVAKRFVIDQAPIGWVAGRKV